MVMAMVDRRHTQVAIDLLILCYIAAMVLFAGARLLGFDMFLAVRPDFEFSRGAGYAVSSLLWVLNISLAMKIIVEMPWLRILTVVGGTRALAVVIYFFTTAFDAVPWIWGMLELFLLIVLPLIVSTAKATTMRYIIAYWAVIAIHYFAFIRFARGYPALAAMCPVWNAVGILDFYMLVILLCIKRNKIRRLVDDAWMSFLVFRQGCRER